MFEAKIKGASFGALFYFTTCRDFNLGIMNKEQGTTNCE
jgi:hypothetical protein